MTKLNLNIPCPNCEEMLEIGEFTVYDDVGKDSEIEWNCPNGCTYDEKEIEAVDAKINELLLAGER